MVTDFDREALAQSLRVNEGFRAQVYKDSLGLWTIGYGRLVDPSRPGSGISKDEAEVLLQNDIAKKVAEVRAALPWVADLSDARQRVLYEMAFQLGTAGLLGFKNTLAAIKAGNWQAAHDGMLASLWAKQTPSRAREMAARMLKG